MEGEYGGWGWGKMDMDPGGVPKASFYWPPPVSGTLTLSGFWRLKFNNALGADCGFRIGGAGGFISELIPFLYIPGGRAGRRKRPRPPSKSRGLPCITSDGSAAFPILLPPGGAIGNVFCSSDL